MNTFRTIRHGAFALFFVLITVLGITGVSAAAQDDAAVDKEVSEQCTFFHDVGGPPYIDEACAASVRASQVDDTSADEAVVRLCGYYDPHPLVSIDESCAATVRGIVQETQADEAVIRLCGRFDTFYRLTIDETCAVAVREATLEAVGWSDYDSIAIGQQAQQTELAKREAAEEAAGWTDFDSTAIVPEQSTQQAAGLTGVEIP